MDIRHFTIQQWVAEDLLCLRQIIDTADKTKALGWTLLCRHHMNFAIGQKIRPEYLKATVPVLRDFLIEHFLAAFYHRRVWYRDCLSL